MAAVTAEEIHTTREKPGLLHWAMRKTLLRTRPSSASKDAICKDVNFYEQRKIELRMG